MTSQDHAARGAGDETLVRSGARNRDTFSGFARYYELLYRDKDYAAEADRAVGLVRRAVPDARAILEFGSGTGRHGRLLAERGFQVCGVERSAEMSALARADVSGAGSFTSMVGDIRTIELNRRFDAVVSLFHVVSYQLTDEDLRSVFANATRHVIPGGVFLFDVWHGPAVLSQLPSRRVKTAEDDQVRLTRVAEPRHDGESRIVTVGYTLTVESKATGRTETLEEEHHVRYLFPDEVTDLAARSGFEVELSEELVSGRPPGVDTWAVAYLLRRGAGDHDV